MMDKRPLSISPIIKSLTQLLENLKNGDLQVPEFQRDFVWERDNIKDLFDSIKRNYPIGSLLLWKPAKELAWPAKEIVGSFYLPKKPNPMYVLDGCQRLSSLLGCLTNPEKSPLACDKTIRQSLFDLYYNLKTEEFSYLRNYSSIPPFMVPVCILMSSSDFRQYSRKTIETIDDVKTIDLYLDRADALSRSLIDYHITSIEINNATIEDAVDIFSRINSKGTDISYDWMVNALSYTKEFSFALELDKLKDELDEYNFGDIKRNALFRCVQSSFGKLYIDNGDIENLAKREDFREVTLMAVNAIKKAVRFLYEELHVVNYKLLPYDIQLVFMTVFFERLEKPTCKQLDDLKKWFWHTSYTSYFTVFSLSGQRKAFECFTAYLDGLTNEILYTDTKNTLLSTVPFPKTIYMGSVRSKCLILFEINHILENNQAVNQCSVKTDYTLVKIDENKSMLSENVKVRLKFYLDEDTTKKCLDRQGFAENESFMGKTLLERRSCLMKEEKAFVEGFGLEYTY